MKASALPPVSIVVPTLNEAGNLPLLFERIYNTMQAAHIAFEIIVIDDHSSDETAAIARSAASHYNIRLILKAGKPGKAYSLQQGFEAASYDLICMIDADLQYPPEAIKQMYHKLLYTNADIIITNRVDQKTSFLRRLSTKVFHLVFTRFLFGIDYDTQSGLKLFKKRVLQDMQISPSPWTFDLEFVVRSLESNYVILSQDIAFAERYRGVAKISVVNAAFEMAWQSLKLRRRVAARRVRVQYRSLQPLQQQRGFNVLSILLIGMALAFGTIALQPSQADALTLPKLSALLPSNEKKTAQPAKDITVKTPVGTVTVPTTDTSSSSQTTTTQSSSSTTPSATTAATPATNSTTTSNASTALPSSATTTSTSGNNATSSTLQTGNGENAAYYPKTKLSASKTNRWLGLALQGLGVGAGLIIISLSLLGIRATIRRAEKMHTRQTLSESR